MRPIAPLALWIAFVLAVPSGAAHGSGVSVTKQVSGLTVTFYTYADSYENETVRESWWVRDAGDQGVRVDSNVTARFFDGVGNLSREGSIPASQIQDGFLFADVAMPPARLVVYALSLGNATVEFEHAILAQDPPPSASTTILFVAGFAALALGVAAFTVFLDRRRERRRGGKE